MHIFNDRLLVVTSQGRTVALQTVTATERYAALLAFGLTSGRAAAVTSGLAILKEGKR